MSKRDTRDEARIRALHQGDVYSDGWHCPKCGLGEMVSADEDHDAVDALDEVVCEECAHVCCLDDILFMRGDIATLIEALDSARAEVAALKGRERWDFLTTSETGESCTDD